MEPETNIYNDVVNQLKRLDNCRSRIASSSWRQILNASTIPVCRRFQYYLDKTVIFPLYRWIGFVLLLSLYSWRAWYLRGWYIVNYGLGIFMLNLFIGFLSPQVRAGTGRLPPIAGCDTVCYTRSLCYIADRPRHAGAVVAHSEFRRISTFC
jgi:hypothetical protein